MVDEPIIKSYVPLDDEDRIEGKKEKIEATETFSLEDERAFTVGLITIIILVIIALFLGIWHFIGSYKQKEENKGQQALDSSKSEATDLQNNSQVLGEQSNTNEEPNFSVDLQSEEDITTGKSYTIEVGDTLYSIGLKLKVNWEDIAQINNLERPYNLKPGEKLKIPERSSQNETPN